MPSSVVRLNASWTVHDAFSVTTDDGTPLRLRLDPPVVIKRACRDSVWRWRMRNIERDIPCLDSEGKGHGPAIAPILRLLRSKENSAEWNSNFRGALASAIANRQWTQERCYKAGYTTHCKCRFCMHAAGGDTEANRVDAAIPTGNGKHRAFGCPSSQPMRGLIVAPPGACGGCCAPCALAVH